MASVNPYLIFDGNCDEAFGFYKSVLGGEFTNRSLYSEAPSDKPLSPEEANRIMHVALPMGNGTILMGGDSPAGFEPVTFGNNFHITVNPDSEADATRIFNGLAAGGQVVMPMEKTFWGAFFGMLKDKFGIQWMVNYQIEEPK